jgi:hypothetical protein
MRDRVQKYMHIACWQQAACSEKVVAIKQEVRVATSQPMATSRSKKRKRKDDLEETRMLTRESALLESTTRLPSAKESNQEGLD